MSMAGTPHLWLSRRWMIRMMSRRLGRYRARKPKVLITPAMMPLNMVGSSR